jgi:hypothetical protein
MNKIVSEHVPASELPQKLRHGIDASAIVTVTVQEEPRPALSRDELKALIEEAQAEARGITTEEAVLRIRTLRDEWDD